MSKMKTTFLPRFHCILLCIVLSGNPSFYASAKSMPKRLSKIELHHPIAKETQSHIETLHDTANSTMMQGSDNADQTNFPTREWDGQTLLNTTNSTELTTEHKINLKKMTTIDLFIKISPNSTSTTISTNSTSTTSSMNSTSTTITTITTSKTSSTSKTNSTSSTNSTNSNSTTSTIDLVIKILPNSTRPTFSTASTEPTSSPTTYVVQNKKINLGRINDVVEVEDVKHFNKIKLSESTQHKYSTRSRSKSSYSKKYLRSEKRSKKESGMSSSKEQNSNNRPSGSKPSIDFDDDHTFILTEFPSKSPHEHLFGPTPSPSTRPSSNSTTTSKPTFESSIPNLIPSHSPSLDSNITSLPPSVSLPFTPKPNSAISQPSHLPTPQPTNPPTLTSSIPIAPVSSSPVSSSPISSSPISSSPVSTSPVSSSPVPIPPVPTSTVPTLPVSTPPTPTPTPPSTVSPSMSSNNPTVAITTIPTICIGKLCPVGGLPRFSDLKQSTPQTLDSPSLIPSMTPTLLLSKVEQTPKIIPNVAVSWDKADVTHKITSSSSNFNGIIDEDIILSDTIPSPTLISNRSPAIGSSEMGCAGRICGRKRRPY